MKTAFIIHGTGGSPEGNWFPWLKTELQKQQYQVFVPRFPTPENQNLENWLETFERYKKYVTKDTIFIAHSVGPSFVCSLLEGLDFSVQACLFASGFLWKLGHPYFDTLNASFTERDFDWEKIRKNCEYFYMCHGSDDPYVPLRNAREMSFGLWIQIDIIEAGKHLNTENGYTDFPYLLEKCKHYLFL